MTELVEVKLLREATAELVSLRAELEKARSQLEAMTERAMLQRAMLQRRIKNQRKALREQHKTLRLQAAMIRCLVLEKQAERNNGYRHAAMIAEGHLFGGWIARAIRVWL